MPEPYDLSRMGSVIIRTAIERGLDTTGFLSMEVIEMYKGDKYRNALVERIKTMDRLHNELCEMGIVIYVPRNS